MQDRGLANFLRLVDNEDVKNDSFVDEIREHINQLSASEKWRREYMDNKTHMMFHDHDIREEDINNAIKMMRNLHNSDQDIAHQLKETYHLSSQEIDMLMHE